VKNKIFDNFIYLYYYIYNYFCPKITKWNFLESRLEKSYLLSSPVENKLFKKNYNYFRKKKIGLNFWVTFSWEPFRKILFTVLSRQNNILEIILYNILSEILFKNFGSDLFYTMKYKMYTVYICFYSASL